jgi:hypothetical protein
MPEFQSRLCNVCRNALDQVFSSIMIKESDKVPHHLTKESDKVPHHFTKESDKVPHHLTKDSLVDSVLVRGCHLCHMVVDFLRRYWPSVSLGLEEDEESTPSQTVTAALSEEDFEWSEFEYANFRSDRLGVRRKMHGLPEDVGLTLQIIGVGGVTGTIGFLVFDCASFARIHDHKLYCYIFSTEGIFSSPTTAEAAGIVLTNTNRLQQHSPV